MLPTVYRSKYVAFQHRLQAFRTAVQASQSSQHSEDTPPLSQLFQAVRNCFQTEILGSSIQELPPAQASQVQAYHTEINKQLRLLGMDVTFWQAARTPATMEQRVAQMVTRLDRLNQYCAVLLGEE